MGEFKETTYGPIPIGWQFIPATEYCLRVTDGTHDSPKPQKTGMPLVTSKHIKGRSIDFDNAYLITKEDYDKINQRSAVQQWDVIISMIGTCGVTYVERNTDIGYAVKNVGLFKTGDELKARWLDYYLKSNVGQSILEQQKGGTTQEYIALGALRNLPILVPTNGDLKAIVTLLSSLDAKIDLLHRQNKTLEAMAEALFRQWFVEEADEGWEEVELGRFVDCVNGVSYKSSELNPSKTALVTLKNFARDGGFRLDGFKEFDGAYKPQHEVFAGDLVVAHTDITQDASLIGNPVLVVPRAKYDKLVISMDLVKVVPKEAWCSKVFLYHLMRNSAFKEHAVGYSNGSTVLHLSKKAIPDFEFMLPPQQKVVRFTEIADGLHRKRNLNIVTIDNLTALRDTLLPKLMSGEVRVENPS